MITRFDHVTIAVTDVDAAVDFFALLGFEKVVSVRISGERMASYMGVSGIDAEHVTLALAGHEPRLEVQLLRFHSPELAPDPALTRLDRLGFNHICFAVTDLDAEIARLTSHGIKLRNDVMEFHDRKLVFVAGPEGSTIELAQWL
jgi:catechol 2,3-dioxygenase-like lactoylglutathione lyase family enzyme